MGKQRRWLVKLEDAGDRGYTTRRYRTKGIRPRCLTFNVYRSSLRSLEFMPRPAAVSRKFRGFESTSSAYDAGLLAAAGCENQERGRMTFGNCMLPYTFHLTAIQPRSVLPLWKTVDVDTRLGTWQRSILSPESQIPNPKSRTLRRTCVPRCGRASNTRGGGEPWGQDRKRVALECAWES